MNDDQLLTKVRDSFAGVRLPVPVEQTVRRGRVLRRRGGAYRVAGVAGAAAIAGVTAVAVTGLGRATVPSPPTPPWVASAAARGTTLDAWTVTRGPGGAIEVTVSELENASGLQSALRAAGVPIRVAFQVGMPSDSPPLPAGCASVAMSDEANAKLQAKILGFPDVGNVYVALTFYPARIPDGIGIYLAVQSGSNSRSWGWGLDLVQSAPACTGEPAS
jgi:hypothetical protein